MKRYDCELVGRGFDNYSAEMVESESGDYVKAEDVAALKKPSPETGLMPCPFCGGTDIVPDFWLAHEGQISGPGCMDCGGSAESFEAWNKRA